MLSPYRMPPPDRPKPAPVYATIGEIPVRKRHVRFRKRVRDRLVVLVDKHNHPLPRIAVEAPDQVCEALRRLPVQPFDPRIPFRFAQLRVEVRVRMAGYGEGASAEADPNHRMSDGPIPFAADRRAAEQLPVALGQLLRRVDRKALPEAPRTRQEMVFPSLVRRGTWAVLSTWQRFRARMFPGVRMPTGNLRLSIRAE